MCTAEILHIVNMIKMHHCAKKNICAHAQDDIFDSLHVNEKG